MTQSLCTNRRPVLWGLTQAKGEVNSGCDADTTIMKAFDEMAPYRDGQVVPLREFRHLSAKYHSSQFVAQTVDFGGILGRAELFGEGEELFLLAALGLQAILDEFGE
jgi:hypothetical protein